MIDIVDIIEFMSVAVGIPHIIVTTEVSKLYNTHSNIHSVLDFSCIVTYYACSSFVSVQCTSMHCINLY